MPAKKIFISYSRRNSEFAEKLTQEIIQSGGDVWFDQLNIEAGAAWDSSIDQALDDADCMVLILSRYSVNSENVMDEVSFALGENKTVIPVLIEDCDVPFRLRRLPTYDLRKDFVFGMNSLLKALDLDAAENQTDWNDLEKVKLETARPKKMSFSTQEKSWKKLRKWSLFLIVVISIPAMMSILYTSNFVGLLGAWLYFVFVLFGMLTGTGLKILLRKFRFGRRFLKHYEDAVIPAVLLLLTLIESYGSLTLYLLFLFILVIRIPRSLALATNVDYFINLIVSVLIPALSIGIIETVDWIALIVLGDWNIIIGISLLISTVLGFLTKLDHPKIKLIAPYHSISFFYLFIFLLVANMFYRVHFRLMFFTLVFLLIGHTIHRIARNTEWKLIRS